MNINQQHHVYFIDFFHTKHMHMVEDNKKERGRGNDLLANGYTQQHASFIQDHNAKEPPPLLPFTFDRIWLEKAWHSGRQAREWQALLC
jgi:hypothetical protein